MSTSSDKHESLRTGLTLCDGTIVFLRCLHQTQTYLELVEGSPTKELNDELVAAAEIEAAKMFHSPTRIVEPIRTRSRPGNERLPAVVSFGSFWSMALEEGCRSVLTVVWFQDEFGVSDPIVTRALRAIPWSQVAVDVDD